MTDKEVIKKLKKELEQEKEKNEKLEKQMGKDLDVVYLKGIYDARDKWQAKIKAKIEEDKETLKKCNKAQDIDRIKALNERILFGKELLEE